MKTDFSPITFPAPSAPPESPRVFLVPPYSSTATRELPPAASDPPRETDTDITTSVHFVLEKSGYRHGGLND